MPSQDQPHTLIRYQYRIQLQCLYQIGDQEDQTLYQHLRKKTMDFYKQTKIITDANFFFEE